MPKVKIWIYRPDKLLPNKINPECLFSPYGMSYSRYKEIEKELRNRPLNFPIKKDYQVEVPE